MTAFRMRDIARFVAVLTFPFTVVLTGCKLEASATPTSPTGELSLVVPEKQ